MGMVRILLSGTPTLKSLLMDVFRDADEEASSLAELTAAVEKDSPGDGAAQGSVGGGGVVAVEGDEKRHAELFLQRKSGGSVESKMRVEKDGAEALNGADELWRDAGGEIKAAAQLVGGRIGLGEQDRLAGIDGQSGRHTAQPCEYGRVTAQGVCLRLHEGLRRAAADRSGK